MNNHPLQMSSSNGGYCNITYQHNQPMTSDHQEPGIQIVPARQDLLAHQSVDIISPEYQSQPVYEQQLQQVAPVYNNQGYIYMQSDQMNDASSYQTIDNAVAYEQPQAYRSQVNYVPQLGQQQMTPAVQYNPILNRDVPQMQDSYQQQYYIPASQPRQMISSGQMVNYSHQNDVLSPDSDLGRELIDESQIIYQQSMDLHPTIKQQHQHHQHQLQHQQHQLQQQQQQQELRRRQQQETIVGNNQISTSSSDVSASFGVGSYCNNNQLVNTIHDGRPMSNPMVSQIRTIPRSKSDLEASDIRGTTFEQFNSLPRFQNPKSLSTTTPYINQQHLQQQPSAHLEQRRQVQHIDMESGGNVPQAWLDTICNQLIEHMDRFGICVIDNFLGPLKGELILREVQQLYNSGQYTKGRLVGDKIVSRALGTDTGLIRSDRVIWIDGYEDGCEEINNLIQTLCSVITNSSRLSLYRNNRLDKIFINKRTKAHVACYPGNGTRYIKHVDNPNGDGRVITSIYYLNKDWNTKRDGGLLRMFPAGINQVANIEPLFDRVLFFWSDRRNPHEVLPAHRDRFAITVWYISENQAT